MSHPTVSDIPESRMCRMRHITFSVIPDVDSLVLRCKYPKSRMGHSTFNSISECSILLLVILLKVA